MKKLFKLLTVLLTALSLGAVTSCDGTSGSSGSSQQGQQDVMTIERAFDDSGAYFTGVLDGVQKGATKRGKDVPVTLSKLISSTPQYTKMNFAPNIWLEGFIAKEDVYIDTISITIISSFDVKYSGFSYFAKNYKDDHWEDKEVAVQSVSKNTATTLSYSFPGGQLVKKGKSFAFYFLLKNTDDTRLTFGDFTSQEDIDTKYMDVYGLKMTFKETEK